MPDLLRLKCCGVMEIHGLDCYTYVGPAKALLALKDQILDGNQYHKKVPFILFTGITKQGVASVSTTPTPSYAVAYKDYGQEFADFLLENKLGTILASEEKENWTLNVIRIWIWSPDYNTLLAWFAAREAEKMNDKQL